MDVYLLPVSADQYELYCEAPAIEPAADRPSTLWARVTDVFRRALAEGEAEQASPTAPHPERSRLRRAITRRLAGAVAEQRLLWQLRHADRARLFHPGDLEGGAALQIAMRLIAADRDKHRRWVVIDALLTIASGVVALVPGPNVLAYYFIFRTVGHYLAAKGAQNALVHVTWTTESSSPLTALRQASALRDDERRRCVDEIATSLGLERLARFVDRMAARSR